MHPLHGALESHRPAQFLGLTAGEVRRDHSDAQQLLLKERDAEGALEDRLQTGMRILDRHFSLPSIEERPDHAADDRSGTDDGHLHDDVVERLRRIARQ